MATREQDRLGALKQSPPPLGQLLSHSNSAANAACKCEPIEREQLFIVDLLDNETRSYSEYSAAVNESAF
jgi:hypothetical protein